MMRQTMSKWGFAIFAAFVFASILAFATIRNLGATP